MQCRASADDKINIEPAMISVADKNDDFIMMESCKSFPVFLKFQMDDKWSEYRELTRKLMKW